MNKIASLTAALWVLGTSAYASEASFNEAVNLYLKGYADCREANTLRSEDIKSARKFFDNYLKILDQAAAMEPSILKTTERDMDANLTYCERVNSNLKMAEAAPVLEASFEHCEAAKNAMANNDFDTAHKELDTYGIKRDEALAITGNIMDVFSLASQVRACGRLEEKLAEARQASQAEASAIAGLQQQLDTYNQKCQTALGFTRQNNFTVDTIDQANRLLADAQQYRKQATNNTTANRVLKAQPSHPQAAALKERQESAGRCEVEVSTLIRNMAKQRQLTELSLETAINAFEKADNQCRRGKQLLAQSPSPQDEVAQIQKQVSTLIGQANTQALAAMAKRHPNWPQSNLWQQLNNQTHQCQQALQSGLAKAAVSPKPTPVAIAPMPAESKPTPVEVASQPATPPQTATPITVTPEKEMISHLPTEAPAAGEPASNRLDSGDWTELADEPEKEAAEEPSSKKHLRKSWTDLVQ